MKKNDKVILKNGKKVTIVRVTAEYTQEKGELEILYSYIYNYKEYVFTEEDIFSENIL